MNDGFINEKELREYINSNSYDNYNRNIKDFLSFVFEDDFNANLPFFAEKKHGQVKPDLVITHNGIKKLISIKKGSGNSVHQEKIDVFFPFVENLFDTENLNYLKKFHYGDGTINDSGSIRYGANECKKIYSTEISKLNRIFNEWDKLIIFLDRFLFVGNVSSATVDIVYHGTIDEGLWATKDEILNYIKNSHFPLNALHFGPLTYQVWGRNEKRMAVHPDRRYIMQVKWGSITKDLKEIRRMNNV